MKYMSNAWEYIKSIIYIDRDLIKIAIPALKSGSVEGIQGTLGGDSDVNSEVNRGINGFIIPIRPLLNRIGNARPVQ